MLIPDKLTPLSHEEFIRALLGGFPRTFGRRPKVPLELAIYYGQGLMENGARLQALHCFCIGNVKATPKWAGDTCQYSCDETVTAAEAAHAQTLGPCELHPQPNGKVRVVCHPPHPWTTFRAFFTATEGAAAYLRLFATQRYAQAALRAAAGDPVGFVLACKAGGYFTAPDVSAYARGVDSIARHAESACAIAMAGTENEPLLTEDEKERIRGLVALTTAESAEEALHEADTTPPPPPDTAA